VRAASGDHFAAALGRQARAKTMPALAHELRWLVGPLHGLKLRSRRVVRPRRCRRAPPGQVDRFRFGQARKRRPFTSAVSARAYGGDGPASQTRSGRCREHPICPVPVRPALRPWPRPCSAGVDTSRSPHHNGPRKPPCRKAGLLVDVLRATATVVTLGECPERQRGRTVNPLADAFVGSSPTSPTTARRAARGCSSMVEQQPSKLMTRVRFPSPAPLISE
jgi:hypothetical protein